MWHHIRLVHVHYMCACDITSDWYMYMYIHGIYTTYSGTPTGDMWYVREQGQYMYTYSKVHVPLHEGNVHIVTHACWNFLWKRMVGWCSWRALTVCHTTVSIAFKYSIGSVWFVHVATLVENVWHTQTICFYGTFERTLYLPDPFWEAQFCGYQLRKVVNTVNMHMYGFVNESIPERAMPPPHQAMAVNHCMLCYCRLPLSHGCMLHYSRLHSRPLSHGCEQLHAALLQAAIDEDTNWAVIWWRAKCQA